MRRIGRMLALGDPDTKVGQFASADLRNFTETLNAYARLVKRAERRTRTFSDAWEQAVRLGMLIVDGELPPEAARLEAVWRDPSTPPWSGEVVPA